MQNRSWRRLCASTAALTLLTTACGGGGGSPPADATGVIPPSSTPAPPLPPIAVPSPAAPLFGALGQTTSRQFATIGFDYRGADGGFGLSPDPNSFDTARAVGLRFNAPSQLHLTVGGFGEGLLIPNGGGSNDGRGRTTSLSYSVLGGGAILYALPRGDGTFLTSTARGGWESPPSQGGEFPYVAVEFMYGVPTAPSSFPGSGAAIYDVTLTGTDPISVDYAAGRVTGTISIEVGTGARTYTLRDVVLTGNGTQFRGRMVTGDPKQDGTLEGQFNGSTGQELMGRVFFSSDPDLKVGIFFGSRR